MIQKQYSVTITVDEEILKQAYIEGHDISTNDCPDVKSMIESELNWLCASGISFSNEIHEKKYDECDRSIFIEWSVDDVRERACQKHLTLSDEKCIEVLEYLENNYDANFGISWDALDTAIDLIF